MDLVPPGSYLSTIHSAARARAPRRPLRRSAFQVHPNRCQSQRDKPSVLTEGAHSEWVLPSRLVARFRCWTYPHWNTPLLRLCIGHRMRGSPSCLRRPASSCAASQFFLMLSFVSQAGSVETRRAPKVLAFPRNSYLPRSAAPISEARQIGLGREEKVKRPPSL